MNKATIYALGFFDGVHLGHQALLRQCRELADSAGAAAGVVTFSSHPDGLVSGTAPALINTSEDRKKLLRSFGMDTVIELPFDKTLMATHWSSFLNQLTACNAVGFVCGSDFRFGAQGAGTAKKLDAFCKSRGLRCAVVPQQLLDGIRVSSTYIRVLLQEGKVEEANRFLGHAHVLSGQVVDGRHLGRTIGIPTANLELPAGVICPKCGVYACKVAVDDRVYNAVTNIGTRPTVGGHHVTVEPWLLDFDGDLYGKTLTLSFYSFLRPEERFDSLERLKDQIRKDADKALQLLP